MKKIIIMLLLCSLILVGCEATDSSNEFNIVTSFYPIYIATSNIIDGVQGVTLDNMTNTTVGCLHDYQLTTRDMNKLERADIFIINGCGMENFLEKAINAYPDLNIVDSSDGILHEHMSNETENVETLHHTHEHGENAHIWVSIELYIKQVENITNSLCKNDIKNAELYRRNAEEYINKLKLLKDEMHNELDNLENRNVVTFHEAFEFFAEEFNLNVVAVIEREPGTNPSAGEVAKIIDKIKDTSANAIFVEPQYESSTASVISRETGIPVYTLDPIVTGDLKKDEYENIMKKNLNVLKEALNNEK